MDERNVNGLFILTRSHQPLYADMTQSLAGRTAILKLMPFSIQELSAHHLNFSLDEYLLKGMYPRIYKNGLNPTKYYRDYVQTYLERDVRKMINVKDLTLFQQFMRSCAARVGQIFNASQLSNDLSVSYHTVINWFSVLEAYFITFRLQPYFENFGKRMIKSPKIYFVDTAVVTYLLGISSMDQIVRDPLHGNLIENFIISEFIKNRLNKGIEPSLYYYRDSNQNKVDLIFKHANQLIPIEIKASRTFNSSFIKGLDYFKNLVGNRCPFGCLIYTGDQEQRIKSFHVYNYKNIEQLINRISSQNIIK